MPLFDDDIISRLNELIEECKIDEKDMGHDMVYKDDDSVFFHLTDVGVTLYAKTEEIDPRYFIKILMFLSTLELDPMPSMVEVKSEGIVCDGKYVPETYFPALYKGATLKNLDVLGPLYAN